MLGRRIQRRMAMGPGTDGMMEVSDVSERGATDALSVADADRRHAADNKQDSR